jgi:hypothetical protein
MRSRYGAERPLARENEQIALVIFNYEPEWHGNQYVLPFVKTLHPVFPISRLNL